MDKPIVITHMPLSIDKEEAFSMSKKDTNLEFAIKNFKGYSLDVDDNIEVFEQKDNMLVTNNGYYYAFYEEDLEHA